MLRVLVTATNSVGSATAASGEVGPVAPGARQIQSLLLNVLGPSGRHAKIAAVLSVRKPWAAVTIVQWWWKPR
jgi:hypothetical protein